MEGRIFGGKWACVNEKTWSLHLEGSHMKQKSGDVLWKGATEGFLSEEWHGYIAELRENSPRGGMVRNEEKFGSWNTS